MSQRVSDLDWDQLGALIDRADNLAHAIQLPLPPSTHVMQLRTSLPILVAELKQWCSTANYDPWAELEGRGD